MAEFRTRNVLIHLPELAKAFGRDDAGVVVAVPDLAAECGCTCSCTCSPSGGGCGCSCTCTCTGSGAAIDIPDEIQLNEFAGLKEALRESLARLG